MKILEICEFSKGICGVWTRVFQEAKEFKKLGYEVTVFSSNIEKATANLACSEETLEGIKIKRFPSKTGFIDKLITKNVTYFNFNKEFEALNPDIVIVHTIHPHSFKALSLCLKNNIPCYLVTHAPFNVARKFPLNLLTNLYYSIKVKPLLSKFTKIITITKWEEKYLDKLGVSKEKISYIPNGIPKEFFSQKKVKPEKKVLFLGRIARVKDLEVLIFAAKLTPEIQFDVVGQAEQPYLEKLKNLIDKEKMKNVKFFPPVYNLIEKIKLIDKHKVFVLPSKREAMPQVLLEAMARGKIVISSKTDGGKELVDNARTGFLFDIGKFEDLARQIRENIKGNKKIETNAMAFARQFSWDKLIKRYKKLFEK